MCHGFKFNCSRSREVFFSCFLLYTKPYKVFKIDLKKIGFVRNAIKRPCIFVAFSGFHDKFSRGFCDCKHFVRVENKYAANFEVSTT